jgi:hypothetical protein
VGDPSDLSSSLYYQPGEKIPYKYLRPVEKSHKDNLEGFSWTKAWRRKSNQSQYSPHGSRMPSRAGSATAPPAGVRMGSLDEGFRPSVDRKRSKQNMTPKTSEVMLPSLFADQLVSVPSRLSTELAPDESPEISPKPHVLEPIHSVASETPKETSGQPFSQEDLNDAVQRAHVTE